MATASSPKTILPSVSEDSKLPPPLPTATSFTVSAAVDASMPVNETEDAAGEGVDANAPDDDDEEAVPDTDIRIPTSALPPAPVPKLPTKTPVPFPLSLSSLLPLLPRSAELEVLRCGGVL